MLKLVREGKSHREIAEILGLKIGKNKDPVGAVVHIAADKERTAILWDKQQEHSGVSSLSKARGDERMEGTK